jgi:predicted RecB family nuclease
MRKYQGSRLYAATDLVNFLGCRHATHLDVSQLLNPVPLPSDDGESDLLRRKGLEHEQAYLKSLRDQGRAITEIPIAENLEHRVERTLNAMRSGAEVIYQGALMATPWHGFSDFLLRVEEPSNFGVWAYDIADTKLSSSAKPAHVLQLCVYADLLSRSQGLAPRMLHVVLGSGSEVSVRASSVEYYYAIARRSFEEFVHGVDRATAAEPCLHCTYCRWASVCEDHWASIEHLSFIAGITRSQIAKCREAGWDSLRALAGVPAGAKGHGINVDTFSRLIAQAKLHLLGRDTGRPQVETLQLVSDKGFNRLPQPDAGDLFFDMEGDPFIADGLEYLFGFVDIINGRERFTPFWAHDRTQEKAAFEAAIDFMGDRLAAYSSAHIYHYAHYEETALKRLAMYHGTRETAVDDLLRQGRLVDLYQVVRESIRTSEPGQSIKDLEVFYLADKRGGEVKSAGDSIVAYEKWRSTQDLGLLGQIAAYNELDCRSTRLCRDWLLTLRPAGAAWRPVGESEPPSPQKIQARKDSEVRTQRMATALIEGAQEADRPWKKLLANLLEFHRREAKPEWWAMFSRMEMTDEELLEDAACLAQLTADRTRPVRTEKRSKIYAFTFPAQDFKLRLGDEPLRAGSGEAAGEITFIDEDEKRVELKLGPSRSAITEGTGLIPKGPIGDEPLREAVYRYSTAVIDGVGDRYTAVTDILARRAPRIESLPAGAAIIAPGTDVVASTLSALRRLQGSYLLIQGPPGAGKTYVSSQAIVALLRSGARIGVASNSHKAINHLLGEVHQAAVEAGVTYRGVKKSSREEQFTTGCPAITNTLDNKVGTSREFNMVAGTAWLFARPEMDQSLDYLIVDEAGQVSLGNLVAMGVAAKNIVLVGDQMQLSQPIQGSHPEGSGTSGLDHLMGAWATVPADRGVFLGVTRRMHPNVCKFISDAVYDGRLTSHVDTLQQRLLLPPGVGFPLAATGIRFMPISHQNCAQRCHEEADAIAKTYLELLRCRWVNQEGLEQAIAVADILVVSPYNMQVDLLRSTLPSGARVGTVDKFQGQQGAVVLFSMATSSGEDLPRQIEFLYSRNRLNVAISRARCLAVIFANPKLLEIPCSTIEQMQLVNTLCWAKVYADATAVST